MKSTTSVSQTI